MGDNATIAPVSAEPFLDGWIGLYRKLVGLGRGGLPGEYPLPIAVRLDTKANDERTHLDASVSCRIRVTSVEGPLIHEEIKAILDCVDDADGAAELAQVEVDSNGGLTIKDAAA